MEVLLILALLSSLVAGSIGLVVVLFPDPPAHADKPTAKTPRLQKR